MKKLKKPIIISIILLVVLVTGFIFVYNIFRDKNSLTISEKSWISNNKNSVYSLNVVNDVNVFGKNGNGVFFDFINDINEDLELKLTSSVYSYKDKNNSLGFSVSTSYNNRDLLLYTDNYVVLSKNKETLVSLQDLSDKNIGVVADDLVYVSNYYKLTGTIKTYNENSELVSDFDNNKLDYIIMSLGLYKDVIISKSYNICYFFNDAKLYYYLQLGSDNTLNSIITKYYNNWYKDSFNESYNKNNYNLFVNSLNITDVELDKLSDKDYKYQFMTNQPYSFISKENLSGIASDYINSFKEFSDLDFDTNRIRRFDIFKNNITNSKIDLYFNEYNIDTKYQKINTNFLAQYYIITNINNSINIDSINRYNGEIYVLENSLFYNYLTSYNNITIKTFKNNNKINKLIKKGYVVLVDKYSYDYYLSNNLSNTYVVLEDNIRDTYSFYYKNNTDAFYKLFSSYINTINPKDLITSNVGDYYNLLKSGSLSVRLSKYFILIILIILLVILYFYKFKKKVVLNTKVKNNEKIRYVDMLTSLKNRNYLNDRFEIWNQNTVYPQAVIVIDLNNIKYLNDTFGHAEGDKQIVATSNILLKTQLDNTEVIRTDGNEFMIYLVGYNEKQVVSYIKKLVKEFKRLPYEYGVAIGFSIINNDLKLVEDAFNEASLQMRNNKEKNGDIYEK